AATWECSPCPTSSAPPAAGLRRLGRSRCRGWRGRPGRGRRPGSAGGTGSWQDHRGRGRLVGQVERDRHHDDAGEDSGDEGGRAPFAADEGAPVHEARILTIRGGNPGSPRGPTLLLSATPGAEGLDSTGLAKPGLRAIERG